jgi:ATP-dependent Clp protease adaptor protein ClpS
MAHQEEVPYSGTAVITRESVSVQKPKLYRVLLHNDDFTPMEFVVEILTSIFKKQPDTARKIMLDVHHHGQGLCGIYPYDVAETRVALTTERARHQQFPLKCTMEPEEDL